MPRYQVTFAVETPLMSNRDFTFSYGGHTAVFELAERISEREIGLRIEAEGRDWCDAVNSVMDAVAGRILDAVALHRKTTLMLMGPRFVLKDQAGAEYREVIDIDRTSYPMHPHLDERDVDEINRILADDSCPQPATRWLRYSYRPVTTLDRFLSSWMAFENLTGSVPKKIACECGRERTISAMNHDAAFAIISAGQPEMTREQFNADFREWRGEVRSAVFHGGREADLKLRSQMLMIINAIWRGIEARLSQDLRLQNRMRSKDAILFEQDYVLNSFVRFKTIDIGSTFAPDAPKHPEIAEMMYGGGAERPLEILQWQDTQGW